MVVKGNLLHFGGRIPHRVRPLPPDIIASTNQ
jgi:hypothetical protein